MYLFIYYNVHDIYVEYVYIYISILNLFIYYNVIIYIYTKLLNESHAIWRGTHFHDPGKPYGYIDCQKTGV